MSVNINERRMAKSGEVFSLLAFFLVLALVLASTSAFGQGAGGDPPYCQGADAINRLVEKRYVLHEDGSVDYHLFMRTEIMTYRGKKQSGDVKIPYNSSWETVDVDLERTRTVLPDGSVIPVHPKEINDIQDPSTAGASIYSSARLRVVNFPSVEPGTTVELAITVHTKRPGMRAFWTREFFFLTNPTARKVVEISAPASIPIYYGATKRGITFERHEKGKLVTYRWESVEMPRALDEPMSPPPVHMSPVVFITTIGSMEDVARFYNTLIPWEKSNLGKDSVPEALGVIDDPDQLYVRFMSLFKPYVISFLDTDLKPQTPAATLSRGYGTPLQLAWLFYEILKSKGMDAHLAVVTGSINIGLVPIAAMPDLFPHVVVKSGDRWYRFNRKELSPGVTGLHGHTALLLEDASTTVVQDSFPEQDITTVIAAYAKDGTTSGTLVSTSAGEQSADTRRGFRYLSGRELEVARSMVLHTVDPLARGVVGFVNLDDLRYPVTVKVEFTIPESVPSVADSSFFPVPTSSLLHKFSQLSRVRNNPLWFPENSRELLIFVVQLPAGAEIGHIPKSFCGRAGPFSWRVDCTSSGRTVYYTRELVSRRGIMKTGEEYERFLDAISRLTGPGQGIVMFSGMEDASLIAKEVERAR